MEELQAGYAIVKDFIGTLGFPIFVAIMFLVRIEPLIKKNTEAYTALTAVIQRCNRWQPPEKIRLGGDPK